MYIYIYTETILVNPSALPFVRMFVAGGVEVGSQQSQIWSKVDLQSIFKQSCFVHPRLHRILCSLHLAGHLLAPLGTEEYICPPTPANTVARSLHPKISATWSVAGVHRIRCRTAGIAFCNLFHHPKARVPILSNRILSTITNPPTELRALVLRFPVPPRLLESPSASKLPLREVEVGSALS